jgi:hypothetical protein
MPKIRNIIIFVAIAAILILVYIFFVRPASSGQASLVSSTSSATLPSADNANGSSADTTTEAGTSPVGQDFLSLLLNVKNIKLDDSIFSDPAFINLRDSSITLVPDAVIGRPNPFAQFGDPVPTLSVPSGNVQNGTALTPATSAAGR